MVPPQAVNGGDILGATGGSNGPLDLGSAPDGGTEADDSSDDDDSDDNDSESKKTTVDAGFNLINSSPVDVDLQVDDPVTSGSDAVIGD